MTRARRVIAGGESSNARVFPGATPIVIKSGEGCRFRDLDSNVYIDLQAAYGPLILGHRHPAIVAAVAEQLAERGALFAMPHELNADVAERVCAMIPSVETLRFANSGTEAMTSAVRLARAATGRLGILRFEGHYHGWSDALFSQTHPPKQALDATPPLLVPRAGGVPPESLAHLQQIPWNDQPALERAIESYGETLAAVVCEPVMGNCGCIEPDPGFLERLRELTREQDIVLIFDEVITGFRLAPGGAQQRYGVVPDLTVLAKAMGGGLPVAAFGGRRDLMELLTTGKAFHGGTYAGNPLALAGAAATLRILDEDRDAIYSQLYRRSQVLISGLQEAANKAGVDAVVQGPGPMFQIFLVRDGDSKTPLRSYRDVLKRADPMLYLQLQRELQARGVYIHPDQYECAFITAAHDDESIDQVLIAATDALCAVAASL